MIALRDYQDASLAAILAYWGRNGGNALVDLATGTGKSVVIAQLIREIAETWPDMRVLVLTHVKELVEQDYRALIRLWPSAPVGINSAGLGQRDRHSRILFASIQSVHRDDGYSLGPRDLVLIDECHLVPKSGSGMYRTLIERLRERVPDLRVCGFTATPYRLGEGRLDEGPDRLFDEVVYTYGIGDAVADGWLAPLVSKATLTDLDVSGVARRGGEFVESELQAAVDKESVTEAACDEIVQLGGDRKAWLVFCAGVDHAFHVRDALRRRGISCETVTGETPAGERDFIIKQFRDGRLRCLTNAMVLTTGFDVPGVDLIAMLRPTLSTGLYIQKCGRGTRPMYPPGFDPNAATVEERVAAIAASSKPDCLVLDFADNVKRHGPVDAIAPAGGKKGSGAGSAGGVKPETVRAKECPHCRTLAALNARSCVTCGHEWSVAAPPHQAKADSERLIMEGVRSGPKPEPWVPVQAVDYSTHYKRYDPDAPPTMRVDYVCGLIVHSEWVCFEHTGQARGKAEAWWRQMRGHHPAPDSVAEAVARIEDGETARPHEIVARQDGKFTRIVRARFPDGELERARAYRPTPVVEREGADCWTVLGVSRSADPDEVKSAFRTLARQHHPDMGGSTAAMANINRAYQQAIGGRA